jgi:4-diphosphocytidyl-2-C-methyl-D-erythritol kinase
MRVAKAFAKVNLGLVVGARLPDGKHELMTVLQRIDLHDDIALEPGDELAVEGFPDDTIVRRALELLARQVGVEPRWHVQIEKRIPVAAGLGGGSADAAAALELANAGLDSPLGLDELHRLAAEVGADVPYFLRSGPQLATGDGTEMTPVELPTDYCVVVVVPNGVVKTSTRAVYDTFDERDGAPGFHARAKELTKALRLVTTARDLAALPANDLAASPIADELRQAGAFRADVSGAGPAVYALFEQDSEAERAASVFVSRGTTFVTRPLGADDLPRVAR